VSAFTDELTITALRDGRNWRLAQPLVYEVGSEGSGRVISVPPQFVTDGASVPRALWELLPSWGTYSRAAVVHDYLCDCLNRGAPHVEAKTRREADAIFYEAMVVCGTGATMRFVMWLAVRTYAILAGKK